MPAIRSRARTKPSFAVVVACLGWLPAAAPAEVLDMRFRQLLLDEAVVASTDGVERVDGQFQPSGVRLIVVTEPVERGYVGRILMPKVFHDVAADKYRMWYRTITKSARRGLRSNRVDALRRI